MQKVIKFKKIFFLVIPFLVFQNYLSAEEEEIYLKSISDQIQVITKDLKTLETLIEKIDIPLPQVRIEAIITEVRLKEDQSTGLTNFLINYAADGSLDDGKEKEFSFGNYEISDDGAGGTTRTMVNPFLKNTLALADRKFSFSGVLELAESDSDVKVLSTPSPNEIFLTVKEEFISLFFFAIQTPSKY